MDLKNGEYSSLNTRINPGKGIKMSEEAFSVHNISLDNRKQHPSLISLWDQILDLTEDAWICGFNVMKFDVPMLEKEAKRLDLEPITYQGTLDIMSFYHKENPKTLAGAHKYYLGTPMKNAHTASGDTAACMFILKQLCKDNRIPSCTEELNTFMESDQNGPSHQAIFKYNPNWEEPQSSDNEPEDF